MKKTAFPLPNSAAGVSALSADISTAELEHQLTGWLLDGDIRQHSPATLANRRLVGDKLLWFLREKGYAACGKQELRQFFSCITHGHGAQGGRWGNPALTGPVRPSTVHTYHSRLRTFFRWLVAEEVIAASPMEAISPPTARADQVQPFTEGQVALLLAAARRSRPPLRDHAVLLFLLDMGVRASELCSLRVSDLDMSAKRCQVMGKGSKRRTLYFGKTTAKALWNYLREDAREPASAVFLSDRGTGAGEPLTRWGVRQIVERLGKAAKVENARCSAHTFRHTFAVTFLRSGGNLFSLQQLLGHTGLQMTRRYVALAQGDIEAQHRLHSPVDGLRKNKPATK